MDRVCVHPHPHPHPHSTRGHSPHARTWCVFMHDERAWTCVIRAPVVVLSHPHSSRRSQPTTTTRTPRSHVTAFVSFHCSRTPSLALPVSTSTHAYDRHASARAHFGTYAPRHVHTSVRTHFDAFHNRSQSVAIGQSVCHIRCMTNSGLAHSIEERGNRGRCGVIRDPPRHFHIHEGALAKQDPGAALVAHTGGWILVSKVIRL